MCEQFISSVAKVLYQKMKPAGIVNTDIVYTEICCGCASSVYDFYQVLVMYD